MFTRVFAIRGYRKPWRYLREMHYTLEIARSMTDAGVDIRSAEPEKPQAWNLGYQLRTRSVPPSERVTAEVAEGLSSWSVTALGHLRP